MCKFSHLWLHTVNDCFLCILNLVHFLILLHLFILCVPWCAHMEVNESFLSFYHVDATGQTQVARFGNKYLKQMNHLTGPLSSFES